MVHYRRRITPEKRQEYYERYSEMSHHSGRAEWPEALIIVALIDDLVAVEAMTAKVQFRLNLQRSLADGAVELMIGAGRRAAIAEAEADVARAHLIMCQQQIVFSQAENLQDSQRLA